MRPDVALVIGLLAALVHQTSAAPAEDRDDPFFRAKVAPILESRCLRCHGGRATKGGLSLATADALRAGGDSGPAVEPGRPGESLLIEKVTGDPPEMPKGGKPLSTDEVATLRRWIERGAHWPDGLALNEPKADAGE